MFISVFSSRIRDFSNNDKGAATEWSIMWTVVFLMTGGLAIDYAYAVRTHHMLQSTADAASAAGAVQLWEGGSVEDEAIRYARMNMPQSLHGDVLVSNDVFVGTWNHVTKTFTQTNINPDAVKVQTRRMSVNGNPLPTFLLKFVGWNSLNVASESVSQLLTHPACLNGIIANGIVNMASNNYFNDFCVHGLEGVDLQMGSTFGDNFTAADGEQYPIISVGSPYDANGDTLPKSEWLTGANYDTLLANNTNLEQSFGTNPNFYSKAAMEIETYIADLYNASQPTFEQEALFGTPLTKTEFDALDQDDLASDHYYVTCSGGQKITIDPLSKVLSDVTIMTSCKIDIGQGVTLSNVDLVTTKTGSNVVTMASDVTLGGVACDAAGNITDTSLRSAILSMGDIHSAEGFSVYGSKIISAADIHFAAKSGGINGASIQADGDVFLAAQGDYSGGCRVPLDGDYISPYFRIVR